MFQSKHGKRRKAKERSDVFKEPTTNSRHAITTYLHHYLMLRFYSKYPRLSLRRYAYTLCAQQQSFAFFSDWLKFDHNLGGAPKSDGKWCHSATTLAKGMACSVSSALYLQLYIFSSISSALYLQLCIFSSISSALYLQLCIFSSTLGIGYQHTVTYSSHWVLSPQPVAQSLSTWMVPWRKNKTKTEYSQYMDTRIFIRQWYKSVHWNLFWWHSNHSKRTVHSSYKSD